MMCIYHPSSSSFFMLAMSRSASPSHFVSLKFGLSLANSSLRLSARSLSRCRRE